VNFAGVSPSKIPKTSIAFPTVFRSNHLNLPEQVDVSE
jgi:hypothetical protein